MSGDDEREESFLGRGQMLALVPFGGGWAHLSLALLISTATDGVQGSAPSGRLKAPCQGNMGAPALHDDQGQLLTKRGSPCRPVGPLELCCPPVDLSSNCISVLQQQPLKVSVMSALILSRHHHSSEEHFHRSTNGQDGSVVQGGGQKVTAPKS